MENKNDEVKNIHAPKNEGEKEIIPSKENDPISQFGYKRASRDDVGKTKRKTCC